MSNNEVIDNFLGHKHYYLKNSTGSLHTYFNRLYSYNTCIAQFEKDTLFVNVTKYSVTSSMHVNKVLNKARSLNIPVFTVTDIVENSQKLI